MNTPSALDYTDFGLAPLQPKVEHGKYLLRLYVAGASSRSFRAIANIKVICEEYLFENYHLEIIDLYQQPSLAATEQIVASPTLVKKLPLPPCRLVGDLSDKDRLLRALGIDNAQKRKVPDETPLA